MQVYLQIRLSTYEEQPKECYKGIIEKQKHETFIVKTPEILLSSYEKFAIKQPWKPKRHKSLNNSVDNFVRFKVRCFIEIFFWWTSCWSC